MLTSSVTQTVLCIKPLEIRNTIWGAGDNKTELKTHEETIKALDCAIEKFDKMGFPDDTRMDDIKEFRRSMENDPLTDTYEVWYS